MKCIFYFALLYFLNAACVPGAADCALVYPCKSFFQNFNSSSVLGNNTFNGNPDAMSFIDLTNSATVNNGTLTLTSRYNNGLGTLALVTSSRVFHYGTFTARLKATGGYGLVNSFILKTHRDTNTHGDEIDTEWVFNRTTGGQTQSNYFVNGALDYTKGVDIQKNLTSVDRPENGFHNYTTQYYPDYISWAVDGKVLRTIYANQSNGYYPAQAGYLMLSIWDTCQSPQGTQDWAYGPSEWCNGPPASQQHVFSLQVKFIETICMPGTEDNQTYSTEDKSLGMQASASSFLVLLLLIKLWFV